jgi:hypothetical protein
MNPQTKYIYKTPSYRVRIRPVPKRRVLEFRKQRKYIGIWFNIGEPSYHPPMNSDDCKAVAEQILK